MLNQTLNSTVSKSSGPQVQNVVQPQWLLLLLLLLLLLFVTVTDTVTITITIIIIIKNAND